MFADNVTFLFLLVVAVALPPWINQSSLLNMNLSSERSRYFCWFRLFTNLHCIVYPVQTTYDRLVPLIWQFSVSPNFLIKTWLILFSPLLVFVTLIWNESWFAVVVVIFNWKVSTGNVSTKLFHMYNQNLRLDDLTVNVNNSARKILKTLVTSLT